ncbi:MAG: hypothetical protein M3P29_06370 [Acidobacteriota bacterium]|nr:hypothetical protein [Acidobacteriota bacterium]
MSGIGSVALLAAWRLPGARFCTTEAQEMSVRLARKSIQYNGLESRFTVCAGDLRDAAILANEAPFDLVTLPTLAHGESSALDDGLALCRFADHFVGGRAG